MVTGGRRAVPTLHMHEFCSGDVKATSIICRRSAALNSQTERFHAA